MTEIIWTNCEDELPPHDMRVIVKAYGEYMKFHWNEGLNKIVTNKTDWTPYTPEKWEFLNNDKQN